MRCPGAGRRRHSVKAAGLQVETDLRNEKINYKVREHSLAKVPVILVVGRREAEEGTVTTPRQSVQQAPPWHRGPACSSSAMFHKIADLHAQRFH